MTTLSVPAQACKPAVASPARPKPRPNPRRKLIDPAKGSGADRTICRSIIVSLKESTAQRQFIRAMKTARMDMDSSMVDDLCRLTADAASVGWVLEMFVSELRTILIPTRKDKLRMREEFLLEQCERNSR